MTTSAMTLASLQTEDLANTVLAISREFGPGRPYEEVLRGVCRRIAGFARCFIGARVDTWHVFPDPQRSNRPALFRFLAAGDTGEGPFEAGAWSESWGRGVHRFRDSERELLCSLIAPSFGKEGLCAARESIDQHSRAGRTFTCFNFGAFAPPMGCLLLPANWSAASPEKLAWHLNWLQRRAFEYFEAFYQATPHTFLPSLHPLGTRTAAILACDLRNSTTVFQVLRIGGSDDIRRFVIFLKSFMELATEYIVNSGLGTIHGFAGDGFMATFGEHMGGDGQEHAPAATALALFIVERLHRGFHHLYEKWRTNGMHSFELQYNEDVGVRLGTGAAYGSIHFDEFGTSRRQEPDGSISRGLLYYNAVGDHMNVAARLGGIAHAEKSAVDVVERPDSAILRARRQHAQDDGALDYMAPLVTTKPFALAQTAQDGLLPASQFSTVRLKGIGNRIPVLEIWPEPLDLNLTPAAAAHRAKFPPERVAELITRVGGDPFYSEQVRAIGDSETKTVERLVRSLVERLSQVSTP
jgi:class 3 adenylate cyclase